MKRKFCDSNYRELETLIEDSRQTRNKQHRNFAVIENMSKVLSQMEKWESGISSVIAEYTWLPDFGWAKVIRHYPNKVFCGNLARILPPLPPKVYENPLFEQLLAQEIEWTDKAAKTNLEFRFCPGWDRLKKQLDSAFPDSPLVQLTTPIQRLLAGQKIVVNQFSNLAADDLCQFLGATLACRSMKLSYAVLDYIQFHSKHRLSPRLYKHCMFLAPWNYKAAQPRNLAAIFQLCHSSDGEIILEKQRILLGIVESHLTTRNLDGVKHLAQLR